jgi:hypothetical protein
VSRKYISKCLGDGDSAGWLLRNYSTSCFSLIQNFQFSSLFFDSLLAFILLFKLSLVRQLQIFILASFHHVVTSFMVSILQQTLLPIDFEGLSIEGLFLLLSCLLSLLLLLHLVKIILLLLLVILVLAIIVTFGKT